MAEFAGLGGLWIAAILVVTLAAGLLRGFSGFGSSLLLVPVLGLAMGPVAAVAIGTLLEALATLMLVPSSLAHTTRHRLATMGLSALIAIPVGHLALRELDPLLSNLAISAAVVAMAGLMWRGMSLPLPRGTAGETGAGVASGFLTGFGSIGGPPLVLYILAGSDPALRKRADLIVVSGIAQLAAVVSMMLFGLLTFDGASSAAYLAPVFFGGGVLGARLFRKASERAYQQVALGALFLAAVGLLCTNLARLLL